MDNRVIEIDNVLCFRNGWIAYDHDSQDNYDALIDSIVEDYGSDDEDGYVSSGGYTINFHLTYMNGVKEVIENAWIRDVGSMGGYPAIYVQLQKPEDKKKADALQYVKGKRTTDSNSYAVSNHFRDWLLDGTREMDTDMNMICSHCYNPIAFIEATSSRKKKNVTFSQILGAKFDCFTVFIGHRWHDEDNEHRIFVKIWCNQGTILPMTFTTWKHLATLRLWMRDQHTASGQCSANVYQKGELLKMGRDVSVMPEEFDASMIRYEQARKAKQRSEKEKADAQHN